jgi:hypothetical protein
MIYLPLCRLGAIYVEWSRHHSPLPLFEKNSCNGETIIDIPYCRVIFTPERLLGSTHDAKNRAFPPPAAGTSEN